VGIEAFLDPALVARFGACAAEVEEV
jgi:hypothetical protein